MKSLKIISELIKNNTNLLHKNFEVIKSFFYIKRIESLESSKARTESKNI